MSPSKFVSSLQTVALVAVLFSAFLSGSLHAQKGGRSFSLPICPCVAAFVSIQTVANPCLDVSVSFSAVSSGQCDNIATFCTSALSTCKFEFDIKATLKEDAPGGCADAVVNVINGSCDVDKNGTRTNCTVMGYVTSGSVPFEESNDSDNPLEEECGNVNRWELDEISTQGGGLSRLFLKFDTECRNCGTQG